MHKKKAIVIGAGIAGIATAIRLSAAGVIVHVYEQNTYPGGKLSEMNLGDYRFDCGPSLFTMPQFVEELFELCGKKATSHFSYIKKDVICNYFYDDGLKFKAYSDKEKFAQEAARVFDDEAASVQRYFQRSQLKYNLTASLFLEKSLHKVSTYISRDTLKSIAQLQKLNINTTLNAYNERSFKDPKLVQLFNRFATYNGSSPYKTPGIMSMIPHLEQHYGTFFPSGGMYSITKSLYDLATDVGVKFHFSSSVERILTQKNKAYGIVVDNQAVNGDMIISNMDIVPTYKKLLQKHVAPEKILQQERSSSALIFYWGIKKKFPALDLHNIFFAKEYKKEFDAIFENNTIAKDPTIYINITSKHESKDAPSDSENWFVMVNAPGNTGQNWEDIILETKANIISKLNRILKIDLASLIEEEAVLDPSTIESTTQSYQGSLYGAASNDKFAAFLRHPNFSRKIKHLYFCGGSVHPGGGIPLCLLSAKITTDIIQKDYKL
ncbi:1-hydroxycarotenoid 3,4-desaturase CrtD [Aquimarina sp. W85]|uniref:1-hydroxycarotenoid 3,4-desaturase CrtD n=1 Tax=Aquimarina rhodophyticola TaxID=3342246 RepID=UPI00366BF0A2